MPEPVRDRYVVLPRRGVRAATGAANAVLQDMANAVGAEAMSPELSPVPLTVLDSVQDNGAKLVEIDSDSAAELNRADGPLRALPLIEYPKPNPRPELNSPLGSGPLKLDAAAGAQAAQSFVLTFEDARSHAPVEGATAVAFSDFANRKGAQGQTDANGKVSLSIASATIEQLYVYGPSGYWGAYRTGIPATNTTLPLEPVDISFTDLVRFYYGASRFDPATGVTVGVIDTGCGPHHDLNIVGGHCTVTGEPADAFEDVNIHGSHVAGLIGASGGIRGVAPGVATRAYRVFPPGEESGATNYAILKALVFAANDGCDIVNLSLGGGPFDEIVEEAIADACNQGMLPIIAAGNDGRKAVSFPAAHKGAVAVSALGREGSFPDGSVEQADVLRPPASTSDPAAFIAAFSNVGPQIAVTGAGVGVLSTLPHDAYGPLSGTSMAAPVVAGCIASLLSQNPAIFGMVRDRTRSDAIRNLLLQNCVRFGFGANFEGFGMPDPQVV